MDADLRVVRDITAIAAPEWDSIAGSAAKPVCLPRAFWQRLRLARQSEVIPAGIRYIWSCAMMMARSDCRGDASCQHHSYGEYVFDHSWANGFMRAGGQYYPKMLSAAIPFTPATGPRLLKMPAPP